MSHAIASADLFVEAVVEERDVKAALLADVERAATPRLVLATCTSTMRLSDVGAQPSSARSASAASTSSRRCPRRSSSRCAHSQSRWRYGAHSRRLQVVRSEATLPEVVERLERFAQSLGKETIICKVGERLLSALVACCCGALKCSGC